MVEWLAGNRIRGTSTERTSTTGFNPAVTTGGGWKELARTTLGSAGDNIDVTGIANKRYYMIICNGISTGDTNPLFRVGNGSFDTGNNYAERISLAGASDITQVSQPKLNFGYSQTTSFPDFTVGYIANLSGKEKLFSAHTVFQNSSGSGGAPNRLEFTGKWVNTSNPIDQMRFYNVESGSYNTNSELVILGWDPADTHTTNFWEELASVEYSSGNEWDTGTFTAKKYLWIQFQYSRSNSHWGGWDFNNDDGSGSGYASRKSTNGAADGTISNHSSGDRNYDSISNGSVPVHHQTFGNMFVINNASNEKLWQMNCTYVITTGAGTAPVRIESVGKYANTVDQITKFRLFNGAPSAYDAGIIKVWGSN